MPNPERRRETNMGSNQEVVDHIHWLLGCYHNPDVRKWFLVIGHAVGQNDTKHQGLPERLAGQAWATFRKLLDAQNQEFDPIMAKELAMHFKLGEAVIRESTKAVFEKFWERKEYELTVFLWQKEGYDPGDGRLQQAAREYLHSELDDPNRARSAREIGNQLF